MLEDNFNQLCINYHQFLFNYELSWLSNRIVLVVFKGLPKNN